VEPPLDEVSMRYKKNPPNPRRGLFKAVKKLIIESFIIHLFLHCSPLGQGLEISFISVHDIFDNALIGIDVSCKWIDVLLNRPVEYKAQIELFHRLFFTLAPDDAYIKENIQKSLYLIDDSGKKEYTNLKEKGFYNQIVASSSMVSFHTDSISLNMEQQKFSFFGKQMITRKSAVITRKLITEGYFEDIIRSPNNLHGVMLKNWRIIDNEEISNQTKNSY
jgi:conjugative transposon TraK protein